MTNKDTPRIRFTFRSDAELQQQRRRRRALNSLFGFALVAALAAPLPDYRNVEHSHVAHEAFCYTIDAGQCR